MTAWTFDQLNEVLDRLLNRSSREALADESKMNSITDCLPPARDEENWPFFEPDQALDQDGSTYPVSELVPYAGDYCLDIVSRRDTEVVETILRWLSRESFSTMSLTWKMSSLG